MADRTPHVCSVTHVTVRAVVTACVKSIFDPSVTTRSFSHSPQFDERAALRMGSGGGASRFNPLIERPPEVAVVAYF